MANGGESFDQMLSRVQAKRASSTIASRSDISEGSIGMPFKPFEKSASKDDSVTKDATAPPAFLKKATSMKRFGKATPAQKSMRGGRGFAGGGR